MDLFAPGASHLGSAPPGFAIDSRNLLTYQDSVCVPDVDDLRLLIIQDRHNSPSVGHPGRRKTLSLVRQSFFWPGLSKFIHTFVDSCETCRRIKAARHKPYGHLKSLPVPPHPWSSISMDLIKQLPPSSGFTAILVVVDRLTKMATFVLTTNTLDAPKLAKLFLRHVYSKHGLPTSIVSDRGSKFTSHFGAPSLLSLAPETTSPLLITPSRMDRPSGLTRSLSSTFVGIQTTYRPIGATYYHWPSFLTTMLSMHQLNSPRSSPTTGTILASALTTLIRPLCLFSLLPAHTQIS
ncbi:uncharacterized protein UDID_19189 [Ustilago sp. UG-2017a]|nr:uncharacterized protein UDID_19189 [Ustilago sp. UG-2017a]